MAFLNYHHLLYFWTVARMGSVTRAAEELHLAQPTVSGQVRAFERSLGRRLLTRAGRGVALTEDGRLVYRYADEIFSLGRELADALEDRPVGRPVCVQIGVADAVPKLVARRLIAPALRMSQPVRLVCREGRPERLLADLAIHALDVVLLDAPPPAGIGLRLYQHPLGESGVSIFAPARAAGRLARSFPRSLDGTPFLLPAEGTALRRSLDAWFEAHGVRPAIVGEFEDSSLLKAFAETGAGAFAAPLSIAREVREHYGARPVGRLRGVRERYFAVTAERRIRHPATLAITAAGRRS